MGNDVVNIDRLALFARMDRLALLDAGLRAFDERLPDVVPSLCVVTRYRASSCRRCLAVCPVEAIRPSPWLTVDAERCTSCGACAAACRTGALAFPGRRGELRRRFAAAAAQSRHVTVACPLGVPASQATEAIVLPCVGALAAGDIVAAGAAGLSEITVATGDCAQCVNGTAGRAVEGAVDAALDALGLVDGGLEVSFARACDPAGGETRAAETPVTEATLSRRELFGFFGLRARRAATAVTVPPKPKVEDLHGQSAPPAGHAELLDDIEDLVAASGRRQVRLLASLSLATIAVGSDCDGCGLCAKYCPHGALLCEGGTVRAEVRTCSACGLCVEVCPRSALELQPVVLPFESGSRVA